MEESASRVSDFELSEETFERLLGWLDPNRDQAGEKYERIRQKLTKIFLSRGCACRSELADETINRVAYRLNDVADHYQGDPSLFFYGVAKKILLEQQRRQPVIVVPPYLPEEGNERRYECLDRCLERLTRQNRILIVNYYSQETESQRRELAVRLGMDMNALWVRAHRIRKKLRECVIRCVANGGTESDGETR